MEKVFIVGAVRTAIGKYGGALKNMDLIDLGASTLSALLDQTHVESAAIDQVLIGCCIQSACKDAAAPVIARQILLKAGLPATTLSCTIEKACTSSSTAIKQGFDAIRHGQADAIIAGGVELMSATPYLNRKTRFGSRIGDVPAEDPIYPIGYKDYSPVAVDAGNVALANGIDRTEQDRFAALSQRRYQEAWQAGKFKDEIIPIMVPQRKGQPLVFDQDEFPKPQTNIEGLSKLRTVFGSPTITAGNAPGINDGAAMVLLIAERKLKELHLTPMAEILACETVADEPDKIPIVPAKAIEKTLSHLRLDIDQIDLIEINEAFAAMPLVSAKILAHNDPEKYLRILNKTNVNGGSIAIGHPIGVSGARILVTLLHELRRLNQEYGVSAICGGLAQGDAILIRSQKDAVVDPV